MDDINLIKKNKQLENLEKILDMLPSEKQNIVYTNRRSKETQGILDKILKAPEEIKVDKAKEQEVESSQRKEPKTAAKPEKKSRQSFNSIIDKEAEELSKKFKSFNGKTPAFILVKGLVADDSDK